MKAGKLFDVPLIVTEQYPQRLGPTTKDVDVSHAKCVIGKTQFSMLVPEVEKKMKELFPEKPKDVILFGIEVSFYI